MSVDADAGAFEDRLAEVVFTCGFVLTFGNWVNLGGLPRESIIDKGELILQEHHEELNNIPAVRAMLQSIHNSFTEDRRGICKFRHWNST